MRHMRRDNVALAVCRQQSTPGFRHVFVAGQLFDEGLVSNRSREKTVAFPLYLFETEAEHLLADALRRPNLKSSYVASLNRILGIDWVANGRGSLEPAGTFGPEDVFHYMYGVLHSPSYRVRYEDFLRSDFPRLPLPCDLELFRALAVRGEALVALHLMKSPSLDDFATTYVGPKNLEIERVGWSE